jgi:hypothetical protein
MAAAALLPPYLYALECVAINVLDFPILDNDGSQPASLARAREMRYPGGDVTSDIWF